MNLLLIAKMISDRAAKFWYWVFWIAVASMVIWLIVKILGIVQTPLIFEILPIASGIIALIGIGITLGNYFQKTNFAFDKIHNIESRQNRMAHGLINIEKDVAIIKEDVNVIKNDLGKTNQKVDSIRKDVGIIKNKMGIKN